MAKTKVHGEYLDPSVISGQTQVTAVGADSVLIFDATDNALKKALLSDVIETVADGDISTAKLADDAVTSAKLDTNIDIAGTFDVTGATTLDSTLAVAGDANFDSGTLFVDVSANKVGIGDTTPAARFTIKAADNTYAGGLRIEGTDETTALGITHVNGDNFFSGNATDDHIVLKSDGNLGIGTTPATGVRLDIRSNATATLGDFRNAHASGFGLYVAGGSSSSQYAFRAADKDNNALFSVMGDGKVGIGTTSPTAPLHIKTSTDDAYSLRLEGATNNAANYHGIGFAGESANTKAAILFKDIAVSYARGDMLFCLNSTTDQSNATDADAVMTLKNDGVMKLHGGVDSGRQDLLFNNSYMSIANEATYTLSGVLNTGALLAIGANRSNVGVTYDHCLIFAELGTAATVVGNPSGRFAINSATTANKVNIFVNGNSVVIQNKVASTVTVSVAAIVFQGN